MDKKTICDFCGQVVTVDPCPQCGGSVKNGDPKPKERKLNPFFYNGYIVWRAWIDDFESISRYYWYLGDELVQVIQFPQSFIWSITDPNDIKFDFMGFVWKLFLVAQGEEHVLRLDERPDMMRDPRPATFEIRRVLPEKLTEEEALEFWIERYQ
jgi:hypothetical protein